MRRMFSKGKGLGTVQLGSLLDFSQTSLTSELVFLISHLDIVLWETEGSVLGVKRAIAAVEDVHVRVCQIRVRININGAVLVTQVLGHDGGTVSGVFTVQDNGSAGVGGIEEFPSEAILVVVVNGAVNVAAFILILEAAIDDQNVIKLIVVLAIHELQESVLFNTRQ